ncbi:MAG TPA: hypothetical protein ENI34_10270 [candidate division WOR-3 bacterium]|uniref:CheW-like domain-containing protein n=1 Tax=candidate division WOR-3 bacterium TaxID=2052148 RepID=A0A9C9EPB3_UNCW3|nr:hypothetical protein [candidate division WOR-3 bacterium]
MEAVVVFRIGSEHIGVDIKNVREVNEAGDLVFVPHSPEFLLGLVNMRGNVIPVVSLKKRLGISGEEEGNFLLIVEDKGRIAGLKVDELFGTKKIDKGNINRNSKLISTKREKDFFLGVYENAEKPILLLNLERTLSKEDK